MAVVHGPTIVLLFFAALLLPLISPTVDSGNNRRTQRTGTRRRNFRDNVGFPKTLPNGVPPPPLLLSERNLLVKSVNEHRRHLAWGGAMGGMEGLLYNVPLPGAQRMYRLQWDVTLEDRARSIAATCQLPPPATAGEYRSVYVTKSRATRKDLLSEAAQWWWREIRNVQLQHNFSVPIPFQGTGQSTMKTTTNANSPGHPPSTNGAVFGYGYADPNTGRLFQPNGWSGNNQAMGMGNQGSSYQGNSSYGNANNGDSNFNDPNGVGNNAVANWNNVRKKRQTDYSDPNSGNYNTNNYNDGTSNQWANDGSNNINNGQFNSNGGYSGNEANGGYGYGGVNNKNMSGSGSYYGGQTMGDYGDGSWMNWKNMATSSFTRVGCAVSSCANSMNSSLNGPFSNNSYNNNANYSQQQSVMMSQGSYDDGQGQQGLNGGVNNQSGMGGGGSWNGGNNDYGNGGINNQYNNSNNGNRRKKRQAVGNFGVGSSGYGYGYGQQNAYQGGTGRHPRLDHIPKMVVCIYDRDLMKHPEPYVFTPGPACLDDSHCSTYAASKCNKGLCISPASVLPPAIEQKLKNQLLNDHNRLRRYLAQGRVLTNAGALPPASNMYKLEWSRELEEHARRASIYCQTNANQQLTPSSTNAVNADLGQSVHVDVGWTYQGNALKRGAILSAATNAWWNELHLNGLPLQCVPGQEPQCYAAVRNFTNMAYFRASEMGCGVNHRCGAFSLLVCMYRKGGIDIINHKLYPQGRPCLHDQECTEYPGSWCETRTGLCVNVAKADPLHTALPTPLRKGLRLSVMERFNQLRREAVAQAGHPLLSQIPTPQPRPASASASRCHPTGSSFYQLGWNAQLADRASHIASWCHKERRVHFHYIGTNIYYTRNPELRNDDKLLLQHAVNEWDGERKPRKRKHRTDPCPNYMNMHHGDYVNVACAVNHKCIDEAERKFSLLVCLFQRSHNVPDADLSTPFRYPCQTHTDCTLYPGSSCDAGLCIFTAANGAGTDLFLNNSTFSNNNQDNDNLPENATSGQAMSSMSQGVYSSNSSNNAQMGNGGAMANGGTNNGGMSLDQQQGQQFGDQGVGGNFGQNNGSDGWGQ